MRPQRFASLLHPVPRFGVRVTDEDKRQLHRVLEERNYSVPLHAMILGRRLLRKANRSLAVAEFSEDIRKLCRARILRIRYFLKGRISLVAPRSLVLTAPPSSRRLSPPGPASPSRTESDGAPGLQDPVPDTHIFSQQG